MPTPKSAAAKKTATKTTAKKSTAKKSTTAKKAPAKTKAPAAKKVEGLRKPQVRLLETLAKSKAPLTRKDLAKKAGVDNASCTEYIGSEDKARREANDKKHFPSLVTLKLIKAEEREEGTVYSITALGKKKIK